MRAPSPPIVVSNDVPGTSRLVPSVASIRTGGSNQATNHQRFGRNRRPSVGTRG